MAPKYKLTYFNSMTLMAEPIRLIFAAANVEYEDVRIERDYWPNLKPTTPWGHLPIMEVDGVTICQSTAIARYLAHKFGLAGDNEIEAAKCDEYVDVTLDMRKETMKYFHPVNPEEKPQMKKLLEEEILPRYFDKFTQILEGQGNGHLVGMKLSFADIYVAQQCVHMCLLMNPELLDKHPAMKKFVEDVMSQPGIKEWIQRRPVTPY